VAAKTYAGLGADTLVPRLKPTAMSALKLGAEEGFVLSRVDGRSTVAQICLLVPFEPARTAAMLAGLVRAGALEIPGSEVVPEPVALPGPPPPAPLAEGTTARSRVATPVIAGLELSVEQARRIDELFFALEERDAFELLEIGRGADKKEVKRAYFRLSKEFHPDRFFNKNLGPYKDRLSKIFQSVKAAFELLSDDARRAAYEESKR
jgi:hypothetical protein